MNTIENNNEIQTTINSIAVLSGVIDALNRAGKSIEISLVVKNILLLIDVLVSEFTAYQEL